MFEDGLVCSEQFNESYFSNIGAITEKTHIFIKGNALEQRFYQTQHQSSPFLIAEVGFGLGINFLLTLKLWLQQVKTKRQLHYLAAELYPVTQADLKQALALLPELAPYSQQLIESYPCLTAGFHRLHFGHVSLTLMLGDAVSSFKQLLIDKTAQLHRKFASFSIDCWFFDGFSPKKNQELWTEDLLDIVRVLSNQSTTLTSYSVAACFKKALQSSGFQFTKKKGVGAKREFLFAVLAEQFNEPASSAISKVGTTPWHCLSHKRKIKAKQKIAVIGAGFAGCLMARRLADRGHQVTLFEKQTEIATQGSGNALAMVHFNLSAHHNKLNDFMLSSFLYAQRFYQSISGIEKYYGIADLMPEHKFLKVQQDLKQWQQSYPDLLCFLSQDELSEIAGVEVNQPGVFWPKALMVSPQSLCHQLISNPLITLKKSQFITQLVFEQAKEQWQVDNRLFDQVIMACGASSIDNPVSTFLALESVPGMVSHILPTKQSQMLKIGLTGMGYVTPSHKQGLHIIGGSYHAACDQVEQLHQQHLQNAAVMSSAFTNCQTVKAQHRFGLRAKSYDYLPFVGAIPKVEPFLKQYQKLKLDKNFKIAEAGHYQPGLYALTGFGSHGFTTIPLSVELLLNLMFDEPAPLSQELLKNISPSRVLIRRLIKRSL